ncbi:MAG: ribosome-associated translation inhibitor RaiA, partial [Alphaproteobacteria bacterium]|nr:ribosome-associated translation inhibitor RaiA [Alphaproteobacteria bacterium]
MDIRVSGHQMDTGEALQTHTKDCLKAIVDKYFSRALSSHVTFGRAPAGGFRCDIIMHVMHNLVLKATGTAQGAHLALDQAAEKIDKQLRRYKRRLKDRHEQVAYAQAQEDAAYTIFQEPP